VTEQTTPGHTPVEPVEIQERHDRIMAEAERIRATGETVPRAGRDPVNQPMINNWVEAIGDTNPRYLDGEAPPAMAQVWTMGGLHPQRDPSDPLHAMMTVLTDEGFTGVLGTNCEQTYDRYLRVGEELTVTTRLESVDGPKQTGVGEGYFVTTRNIWRVAHPDGRSEQVASMLFRVLKFVPRKSEPQPTPVEPVETQLGDILRPQTNRDTEFFWEGTKQDELRIQRCNACGALRHPPGPSCPACHAVDRSYVVSSGRGTVFSYVVHRHPPVPGRELPILIALVDLEEGTRLLAELVDCEPEDVEVGMPVEVGFHQVDDDLTLPVWRRA
jgi:uncharacterized OB-fold protein